MFRKTIADRQLAVYAYEPIGEPVFDDYNNIIAYKQPLYSPVPYVKTEDLRRHNYPNELGCSADPKNVSGFAATVEVINASRNMRTSGISQIGADDCGTMSLFTEAVETQKKLDNENA